MLLFCAAYLLALLAVTVLPSRIKASKPMRYYFSFGQKSNVSHSVEDPSCRGDFSFSQTPTSRRTCTDSIISPRQSQLFVVDESWAPDMDEESGLDVSELLDWTRGGSSLAKFRRSTKTVDGIDHRDLSERRYLVCDTSNLLVAGLIVTCFVGTTSLVVFLVLSQLPLKLLSR